MNNYSSHFYVSIESLIFLKEIQKGFPQFVNCIVTVVPTAYTGWLGRKDNFFSDVTVSVIVRIKYISSRVCFWTVAKIQLLGFPDLSVLDFYLWC
jgi:hypothetical protein